jgi:peptidyl-prolyl cis-trans isomerase D
MLQSIRDNSSGWVAKVILGLVILVMAFFGFGDYLTPKFDTYAAKVTAPGKWLGYGEKSLEVSVEEFRRRFDQERSQARAQQGEAFDAQAFEKIENKRRVLEQMIDEAVMRFGAEQAGIVVTKAMVQAEILKIDAFKVDGKFDQTRYQLTLQQQQLTPAMFENLVQQDLLTRFVAGEYIQTGVATKDEAIALLKLTEQRRSINYIEIPVPALDLNASDAELAAWYKGHQADYRTQETVTVEYVELDESASPVDLVVDESVLRQRYQEQIAQYSEPEQRVASHILVAVDEGASASTDAAAKTKAQALAKQAQANPAAFAELAKSSDDLASKDLGGDLGPVEKSVFGDAFDKAFFALKPGQVSEPVRMPDGWHVLYYREMIAGVVKPFEQVRDEIEQSYLASEKERRFNDIAGKMVSAVEERATSLQPAAQAAAKPLLRSAAFTRTNGEGIAALEPIRKAAFSDALLKERQVSELIELAPNHVVLMRVLEHKPAAVLPLAQVKDMVRLAFVQDRAAKQAEKEAKDLLARLNKGETLEALSASLSRPIVPVPNVTRQAPMPQLQPVVREAFRLAKPSNGKAGGAGVAQLPDGRYLLMQLVAVMEPEAAELGPEVATNAARSLSQLRGDQQAREYIKALRKRYQIKVAESRL